MKVALRLRFFFVRVKLRQYRRKASNREITNVRRRLCEYSPETDVHTASQIRPKMSEYTKRQYRLYATIDAASRRFMRCEIVWISRNPNSVMNTNNPRRYALIEGNNVSDYFGYYADLPAEAPRNATPRKLFGNRANTVYIRCINGV